MSIFDQVTDAIKQQVRDGRSQASLTRELDLAQTTLNAIISGRRRLGRKTLETILAANPPWLQQIIGA